MEGTGQQVKVADPSVALHHVTPAHTWFTVIDLANALFCLPLHPESQDLFAFTWKGQHLTYTRMPQGYRSTPTIFNSCVKQDLKNITVGRDTVIVQYVDDILISSTSLQE